MRQRIITALIGIPIVLGFLAMPSMAGILALCTVAALIGLGELGRLTSSSRAPLGWGATWILVAALAASDAFRLADRSGAIPALALLALISFPVAWLSERDSPARNPLLSYWVVAPLACVVWLQAARFGLPIVNWATFTLICLWAGDTAAIFAGKALGGPKMAPQTSPNKTWSGGVANFLACAVTGSLFGSFCAIGMGPGLIAGIVIGVMGQLGDLFQSNLKRTYGLKDSGHILPGHGGLLDRIDSLLFAAPAVAVLVQLFNWR